MIIDESTRAGLLNTNDHPGIGSGKYYCIRHLCLPLILAVPMKAKKCHYLLHLKHFSSALLLLYGDTCFPRGISQLLPDTQASPHPYPCWAHPPLPSPVFQTKISQLYVILDFLTWNLPQAHFHTPPRRCLNSIIGELCRRFWMQWHKLEGKPSCCAAK